MRRALKRGATLTMALRTMREPARAGCRVVAVVERRHDLVLEQVVDARRVGRVLRVVVAVVAGVDQPAVVAGVALRPPAVADRSAARR